MMITAIVIKTMMKKNSTKEIVPEAPNDIQQ